MTRPVRAVQRYVRVRRGHRLAGLHVLTVPAVRVAREATPHDLVDVVCRVLRVPRALLFSRARSRDVTYARHLAWYALRRSHLARCHEIARMFGRDHSTVIEGVRRIELELVTRRETRADIDAVERLLWRLYREPAGAAEASGEVQGGRTCRATAGTAATERVADSPGPVGAAGHVGISTRRDSVPRGASTRAGEVA